MSIIGDENKQKFLIKDNLIMIGSKIDWRKSVGKEATAFYYGEEYKFKIVEYHDGESAISIKCDGKEPFKIKTNNFLKGHLGKYLGKFTSKFKVEVGENIQDNIRDLTIEDKQYRIINKDGYRHKEKWYKYKCNKCPNEAWIRESQLLNGGGCNVCGATNPKPLLGYNTVFDLDEYTTKAIGEELAKVTTCGSDKEVFPTCPVCGKRKEKKMKIGTIHNEQSIGCPYCSDGVSFPNKVIHCLCEQLYNKGLIDNFIFEDSPEWAEGKRPDVRLYFGNNKVIIEMDGHLGHGNKIHSRSSMTIEESLANDEFMDLIAEKNNHIVIRINCCYKSTKERFEYIKENILKSKLSQMLDLSNIDWDSINELSQTSLVKIACDYKKNNPLMSTADIAKKMHMSTSAIYNYLQMGNDLGWCSYNAAVERENTNKKISEMSKKRDSKAIIIFDCITLKYIGEEESMAKLEEVSSERYGKKLSKSQISKVCRGLVENHKGFIFRFKNSDDEEDIQITNEIKQVCEYKNNNPEVTTTKMAEIFNKNRTTIIEYLKKGTLMGLCNYDPNEETSKRVKKLIELNKKSSNKVLVFLNGKFIEKFDSYGELVAKSIELLGVRMYKPGISRTVNGLIDNYKGYVIMREKM